MLTCDRWEDQNNQEEFQRKMIQLNLQSLMASCCTDNSKRTVLRSFSQPQTPSIITDTQHRLLPSIMIAFAQSPVILQWER